MFYQKSSTVTSLQMGLIGVLKAGQQGLVWEWSETQGIPVSAASSSIQSTGVEVAYHGGYDGYVYTHDTGNNFDGSAINARYTSPDISYGDADLMKTLHYMRLSLENEAVLSEGDIKLRVSFDFKDQTVPQPGTLNIQGTVSQSLYGTAIYGNAIYGVPDQPQLQILLEGEGHSNLFQFSSVADVAPFTLNGYTINLTLGKRL